MEHASAESLTPAWTALILSARTTARVTKQAQMGRVSSISLFTIVAATRKNLLAEMTALSSIV